MRFPFVSRERFDEERAARLKAETALEEMRQKFLDYIENQSKLAPTTIGENTDLSKINVIPGRPTIAEVVGAANTAAHRRSLVDGSKSIVLEMQEARAKLLTVKRAVNGH